MPTKIPWCNEVWNPITGCAPVSSGCKNCYAASIAKRFWFTEKEKIFGVEYCITKEWRKFSDIQFHEERLMMPYKWKKPRTIFVDSMGDLFHDDVTVWWIDRLFDIMHECERHKFIILTKRPENINNKLFSIWHNGKQKIMFDDMSRNNIYIGVSIEDQETADKRIPELLNSGWQGPKIVSAEPLLGPVVWRTEWNAIDWIIVGGERGSKARPCNSKWIIDLWESCEMPFFFKQWGKNNDIFLHGSFYKDVESTRQFPW